MKRRAAFVIMINIIIGILASCTMMDKFNKGEAKITVPLPHSSARGASLSSDTSYYKLKLFLSGNVIDEKSGKSGDTVVFDNLREGVYQINAEAYNEEDTLIGEGKSDYIAVRVDETSSVKITISTVKGTETEPSEVNPGSGGVFNDYQDSEYVAVTDLSQIKNILSSNSSSTQVFVLKNNIEVSDSESWERLNGENDFCGILDGNGYTVTFTGGPYSAPLFHGIGADAVIKNLKIEGEFYNSSLDAGQFGPFVLNNNNGGLITGCSFKGSVGNSRGSSYVFGGDQWGSGGGKFVGCVAVITSGDTPLTGTSNANTVAVATVYDTDDDSPDDLNAAIAQWNSSASDDKKCRWKYVLTDGKLCLVPDV